MDLVRVDTQRAYERIRAKITTLELPPGSPIDEGKLADELNLGLVPVREALKLLIHDHLIYTQDRGLNVSEVSLADLEQISELRLLLEPFCARQAALRASPDEIAVLDALRFEQAQISLEDIHQFFAVDQYFHHAIARAAHNKYLALTLSTYFGISQRLWYLAAPRLESLPNAVEEHLHLVEAVKNHAAGQAEQIMYDHVKAFYDKVRQVLMESPG